MKKNSQFSCISLIWTIDIYIKIDMKIIKEKLYKLQV